MGYRFRSIIVLKSRYGENQVADCCFFDGMVNKWVELPPPSEIYDYSKYRATDNNNLIDNNEDEKVKSKLDYSL